MLYIAFCCSWRCAFARYRNVFVFLGKTMNSLATRWHSASRASQPLTLSDEDAAFRFRFVNHDSNREPWNRGKRSSIDSSFSVSIFYEVITGSLKSRHNQESRYKIHTERSLIITVQYACTQTMKGEGTLDRNFKKCCCSILALSKYKFWSFL